MKNLNVVVQVFILAVVILTGCDRTDEVHEEDTFPAGDRTIPESAIDLPNSNDLSRFREAFTLLSQYSYTRRTGIIQLSSGGQILAYRNRTTRFLLQNNDREYTVLSVDSMGSFNFGMLGNFVDHDLSIDSPTDLNEAILPEDLPYLSSRNRDEYLYRTLPDTILQNRPTRVVEVIARPESREDLSIYLARHFIDHASDRLVGIHLERRNRSVLFREWTVLYASIAVASDETWLPHEIRTATRLKIPLLPGRNFEINSQFFDYQKVNSAK